MKDRPTPETDEFINSYDSSRLETLPFTFAAEAQALMMRLERERGEARDEMRVANEKITELFTHSKQFYERATELGKQLAESSAYADQLAAGLPDGMLPKDVELLRDANAAMAQQLTESRARAERLAEAGQHIIDAGGNFCDLLNARDAMCEALAAYRAASGEEVAE
jgi:hypothetical protein